MAVTFNGCTKPGCLTEVVRGTPRCIEHSEDQMKVPHIQADQDFRDCIEACDRILTTKGHDYTQGSPERLKNFYATGVDFDVPARKVLAIYWDKHINAIKTFLKHGQVESEPIDGRIHDAINYLLLLFKMLQQERRDLEAAKK
jgi:hypothetical protein